MDQNTPGNGTDGEPPLAYWEELGKFQTPIRDLTLVATYEGPDISITQWSDDEFSFYVGNTKGRDLSQEEFEFYRENPEVALMEFLL